MENNMTLSSDEIEAITTGSHGDPFHILGPHAYENGTVIRVLMPQANQVAVVCDDGQGLPMNRIHWDGLFELWLPERPFPFHYQIQIVTHGSQSRLIEDPYAFGPTLTDFDEYLLAEGTHLHIYKHLGAHLMELEGHKGVRLAVWAPNAMRVSVIGDFNHWDGRCHPMRFHHGSGIWELFIPDLDEGTLYKYEIKTNYKNYTVAKADPVGFATQLRPDNASIVWQIDKHIWQDQQWMANRQQRHNLNSPISIYEVHLGSWQRKNGWEWLTYQELANELVPYVKRMGFTHIELLPITEHPFDGSWGYQVTGYFAPTSRFGTPDEFQLFVDACHQANIGIILDWVPAHFPTDQHGLSFFDGTHLYEHEDPRMGAHPDWGTLIFNYGRHEVSQFLISNALFWLEKYHIDGLRVDAVASMLYLDFSRKPGEWLPNRYGGRENIHAIEFLRRFNDTVHEQFPGILTFAEESTAWPGVTETTENKGLGFDIKWNMGWMHDILQYMSNDPIYRAYHQGTLTFSLLYAFSERFVLPFSHDEVVHLKKSILDKMPGDLWRKFANARLLYGYQWTHPGKKLLFMGNELGQWREWSEERSLDWNLLENESHLGLQTFVADLNALYGRESALFADDNSWQGFTWLDFRDSERSILAFVRTDPATGDKVIVACNFTPVVRSEYRLGVPEPGSYSEILNSDSKQYGGSNVVNEGIFSTEELAWHEQPFSILITLPPLGMTILKRRSGIE